MIMFVVDNSGSQGPSTLLCLLIVSLHLVLLPLLLKLLYPHYSLSFYQHFVHTFINSSIQHSPFFIIFFLYDICEEDVTIIGDEKLNGGCDSYKTNSFLSLSDMPTHIQTLLLSTSYPISHPFLSSIIVHTRIAHFLGPSLALLSAHIRLLSCSD